MKMSTQFTIFFVAFNAVSGIMITMGVAEDLGLNVETGDPAQIDAATQQRDVGLGNSVGGTLFGMYNQLSQQVGAIFNAILPGMRMLRLFIPDPFVNYLLAPLGTLIAAKDLIAFARGTDL